MSNRFTFKMRRIILYMGAILPAINVPITSHAEEFIPMVRDMPEAIAEGYRSEWALDREQAASLLDRFLGLQETDPDLRTYGQWPWTVDGRPGDLNIALFLAHGMFVDLWELQDQMEPELQRRFHLACHRLVEAAKRRWDIEVFDINRDYVAYSNVFALYVQTLTLAGWRYEDNLLQRTARGHWNRWYNHVRFNGVDEFASPGYNFVVLRSLNDIRKYSFDPKVREQAREIMDHLYTLQSVVTHPQLLLPVVGNSRDYRQFLLREDARSSVLSRELEGYDPPESARILNADRAYPFKVAGRAGTQPYLFASYQLADAALGSMTGGMYFWQQIHAIAAVGSGPQDRAVAFLPGTNTPVSGYTDQAGLTVLCVFSRLPNLYHLTQWRGDMDHYRETFDPLGIGFSSGWNPVPGEEGALAFSAHGYTLHVFPFKVESGSLVACELTRTERMRTGIRYHARDAQFTEYVFPDEPDWVGVFLSLTPAGQSVTDPGLQYHRDDRIHEFRTDAGHRVRVLEALTGELRPLFNTEPYRIPLLQFGTQNKAAKDAGAIGLR